MICLSSLWCCAPTFSKKIRSTAHPLDFHLHAQLRERNVLLFLLDGLRADVLYGMCEEGELPNVSRYLMDRGIRARHAVCSLPSVTTPNIAAIDTGLFPGHIAVPGLRFFDRAESELVSFLNLQDYYRVNEDIPRPTLFEALGEEPSAVIFSQVKRGADLNVHLSYNLVAMSNYLFNRWEHVDKTFLQQMRDVAEFANRRRVFPRLVFLHLPGTDHIGHAHGPRSERLRRCLKSFDREFGRLVRALERNGVADRISLLLTADHGQVEVRPACFSPYSFLRENVGLRAISLPKKPKGGEKRRTQYIKETIGTAIRDDDSRDEEEEPEEREEDALERKAYFRRFQAVEANNGRVFYLYLRAVPGSGWRKPKRLPPWTERPSLEEIRNYPVSRSRSVDLVAALLKPAAVEMVAAREGEGSFLLFSKRGTARITQRGSFSRALFSYAVTEGCDPLGYAESPEAAALLDGAPHPSGEWLAATAALPRPDAVAQIPSLFADPARSPDLAVFAAPDWCFEKGNLGHHGGLSYHERTVPLLWAGRAIRKGEIGAARTVDLFPAILEYLGVRPPEGEETLDGVSLLPRIEAGP